MKSKALAEWVIRRRNDLELTQDAVAERMSYGKAYVSKIETGRIADPLLSLLEKLSHALEVSIAEPLIAMGCLKPQSSPEPHVLRLLHYYREMRPEDQKLAEDLIKTLWKHRDVKQEKPVKPKRKTA